MSYGATCHQQVFIDASIDIISQKCLQSTQTHYRYSPLIQTSDDIITLITRDNMQSVYCIIQNRQAQRHQQITGNKSVFSYLRWLSKWHCPHTFAAACLVLLWHQPCSNLDRYLLPAETIVTNLLHDAAAGKWDRETDGRTLYRFIDPASHTIWAHAHRHRPAYDKFTRLTALCPGLPG